MLGLAYWSPFGVFQSLPSWRPSLGSLGPENVSRVRSTDMGLYPSPTPLAWHSGGLGVSRHPCSLTL